MARKGNIVWQVENTVTRLDALDRPYEATQLYALRADGVLLESLKTKREGEAPHHYNWTIRTRKPKANVKEILEAKGYK